MTRRQAHLLGWTLIGAVTALSFVLDYYRTLHSHFNWFMAILIALSVGLVGAVAWLAWMTREADPERDRYPESETEKPANICREET